MKIQKLIQARGVFAPLTRIKLNPKLSYKIYKFLRTIENEEQFFNVKFRELVDEYGKKDDKGKLIIENGNIAIIDGKEKECNDAFNELQSIEVSTPDIHFTIEELKDLTLSVQDIAIIEEFIQEE